MAKKQRKPKVRAKMTMKELNEAHKRMPIRHPEGFDEFTTAWLRRLYNEVGHLLHSTFEKWELGFMRDTHPDREIMLWEMISRTHREYMKANPKQEPKEVLGHICAASTRATDTPQQMEFLRLLNRTQTYIQKNADAAWDDLVKELGFEIE